MSFYETSKLGDWSNTFNYRINKIFFLPLSEKALFRVIGHLNDTGELITTSRVQKDNKGIYRLIIPEGTIAPISELVSMFEAYKVGDSFCYLRSAFSDCDLLETDCDLVKRIITSEMACYDRYRISYTTTLNDFGFYTMKNNEDNFRESLGSIRNVSLRNKMLRSYTSVQKLN